MQPMHRSSERDLYVDPAAANCIASLVLSYDCVMKDLLLPFIAFFYEDHESPLTHCSQPAPGW